MICRRTGWRQLTHYWQHPHPHPTSPCHIPLTSMFRCRLMSLALLRRGLTPTSVKTSLWGRLLAEMKLESTVNKSPHSTTLSKMHGQWGQHPREWSRRYLSLRVATIVGSSLQTSWGRLRLVVVAPERGGEGVARTSSTLAGALLAGGGSLSLTRLRVS